jgi:putative PIN family toxin of toxin-antitoxin system
MKSPRILNIVLDTNILLVSISEYSKYHWIFRQLVEKRFNLFITNEILTEYEEIIAQKYSIETAKAVVRMLLELENVWLCTIYYKYNLITDDPDDDKFVDAALAGNCDFIVTNDKHFNILKSIDFPHINIINIDEFKELSN